MALQQHELAVDGEQRAYWLAPAARGPAPLLVVLHGSGLDAATMSKWTGLSDRGPEAGFATVFPEGREEFWDDTGQGRADGVDDAGFVAGLVAKLCSDGIAQAGMVFLVGLSNGAFFAERLARHGLVTAIGVMLASGTARELSRRAAPRPRRPAAVLCMEGTGDKLVPYTGGNPGGPTAWMARRRARKVMLDMVGREVVAAESLAADWALANGCPSIPDVELLAHQDGDPKVHRLTWAAPGHLPVVLYRIIGGGHGWPGGPQYLPAAVIGRVPRHLDATGIMLEFAQAIVRGGEVIAPAGVGR